MPKRKHTEAGKERKSGITFCRVSIIAFHYGRGRCLACTARSLASLEARLPPELAMGRVWETTGRMARLARTCAEPMTGAQPLRSGEHGVLRHERSHHRQEACTAPRCVLVAPQRSDVSAVARCAMRGQRYLAEALCAVPNEHGSGDVTALAAFVGSFRGPASVSVQPKRATGTPGKPRSCPREAEVDR